MNVVFGPGSTARERVKVEERFSRRVSVIPPSVSDPLFEHHAEVVYTVPHDQPGLAPKTVTLEPRVVDMMLPAAPLPRNARHIWMLFNERLGHQASAFPLVQLV